MHQESEIRAIENKRVDLIMKRDLTAFFNLFSPDFVGNNPFNKIVSAEQVFEFFKKGLAGNVSSFDLNIENIAFVDNIAIVMGQEMLVPKGDSGNLGKTITRRFTNIWIKNNATWKITARQATNISVN